MKQAAFALFLMVSLAALSAAAQDAPPVAIDIKKIDIAPVEPFPEGFRSLFFTAAEHTAVRAALGQMVPSASVLAAPAATAPSSVIDTGAPAAPPRVLHLSGIVMAADGTWSIWLNGRQVTPSSRLPEIRDIQVTRESVALKWFDEQTQAVVPVKMRPHQRFNIDTRTFMPGALSDMPPPAPPATP